MEEDWLLVGSVGSSFRPWFARSLAPPLVSTCPLSHFPTFPLSFPATLSPGACPRLRVVRPKKFLSEPFLFVSSLRPDAAQTLSAGRTPSKAYLSTFSPSLYGLVLAVLGINSFSWLSWLPQSLCSWPSWHDVLAVCRSSSVNNGPCSLSDAHVLFSFLQ